MGRDERGERGRKRGMGYISRTTPQSRPGQASGCVCVSDTCGRWRTCVLSVSDQRPTPHKKEAGELRVDTLAAPRHAAPRRMWSNDGRSSFPSKMCSWSSSSFRQYPLPSSLPSVFFTPHASWKLQIALAAVVVEGVSGWQVGCPPPALGPPPLALTLPSLRAYYRAIIEPPAK